MARPTICWLLLAVWLLAAAALAADDDKAQGTSGLQAIVTTVDDQQLVGTITGLADGQLTLATEPPRTLALADVARIDLGAGARLNPAGGDVVWIGQDRHDLVQVGAASGGNGVQDLHLHVNGLRAAALKQIVVVCRFPGQLRVWRLDTSRSPHWRLAIERSGQAPEAELYLEPANVDSFGHKFDVMYTYDDGTSAQASVTATTHTSNQSKLAAAGAIGPPSGDATARAEVFLAGSGRVSGTLVDLNAESLTLRTAWDEDLSILLLQAKGIWLGNEAPAGARHQFQKKLADPAGQDQVLVLSPDNTIETVQLAVRSLDDQRLNVSYEGQDRAISRPRVLGIVLAAHPPLAAPEGPVQVFVLQSGDELSGQWTGCDGHSLHVETAWASRLVVPGDRVSQIRFRGGSVAYLTEFEPTAVEEVPYFGRVISWRRDAGFDGGPPRLRGKQPIHCLATHARCVLTYALDGQYEKFKATLGFDDSAGQRGRVACRVLVDGVARFAESDFRADADPLPLEISLEGAAQMTLEVDFGQDQDVGDRILWSEPRLFRAEDDSPIRPVTLP